MKRRRRWVLVIAVLVTAAVLVFVGAYSREAHRFLQRCQDAGPPVGTHPSQVSMSYEPHLLRNSVTCTWEGPPGSPTEGRRSQLSIPIFES